MADYKVPKLAKPRKLKAKQVYLVANGDLRESANKVCWEAQAAMEAQLEAAVKNCGYELVRAHPFKKSAGHGFIGSQKEGMRVFAEMDPGAKLIVAEAVWQYSHHVLHGLISHEGPILTVSNWSGQWPGLVGMLNLNGSMAKANVAYSTLWAEDFGDKKFLKNLKTFLTKGKVSHPTSHVKALSKVKVPAKERKLGIALAKQLKQEKAIMGVFDEGCMGMYNAIIPDHLLNPTGVYKERLSQSALFAETTKVGDDEAKRVYQWLIKKGMKFTLGQREEQDLTEWQVLTQCKMYIAATRIADEFGCDCIGIQYQQGLKDCLPASDLVEGMLNNSERPPVTATAAKGDRQLYRGNPLPHFNEVDECAGLDALMTYRVAKAMGQPPENTLHDLRWADTDASGTTDEYVWVFEISGAAPPAHFIDGWKGAVGERQPAMYFRLGGSTLKGISKPGEIVWSRIYVEKDALHMDLGRAKVVELPYKETLRRWHSTTRQWPIMHAVLYGVTRDQMMAKHRSNHIQVHYGKTEGAADKLMFAKAAMGEEMGMRVNLCGGNKKGKGWG